MIEAFGFAQGSRTQLMTPLSKFRDWGLLLACNLIWGSQFVVYKLVERQVGPAVAALFAISCATMLLIPIVHGKNRRKKGVDKSYGMPVRDMWEFILIGIGGQVVAQLFVAWGVRLTLASNAALLGFSLPVSTALMAYLFLGERMTGVRWLSFGLAIAGVVVCSGISWGELSFGSRRFLLGNVMLFLAVNGGAFYNVYSKKLLRRYSPLEVLLYSYYVAVGFLLPIALYTEPQSFRHLTDFTLTFWVGIILLGVLEYFLAMVIFLSVLTRLDATQAGLMNYSIPFFGVLAASLVLHERLTKFMVLGGLLVLASTLLVTVYEQQSPPTTKPALAGKL
jgi:drug/metabolite transporter (DMT)-like permease